MIYKDMYQPPVETTEKDYYYYYWFFFFSFLIFAHIKFVIKNNFFFMFIQREMHNLKENICFFFLCVNTKVKELLFILYFGWQRKFFKFKVISIFYKLKFLFFMLCTGNIYKFNYLMMCKINLLIDDFIYVFCIFAWFFINHQYICFAMKL